MKFLFCTAAQNTLVLLQLFLITSYGIEMTDWPLCIYQHNLTVQNLFLHHHCSDRKRL
jgi:hypothetical protein